MEQVQAITLESVLSQARQLSATGKVRLLEAVLPEIAKAVEDSATEGRQSCHGLLSDLGPAPSSDDIDEI